MLLVPGAAPNHPEKRWPAKKYGKLAKMLANAEYQPVILGTETEKDITEIIVDTCPQALDLTGQTSLSQIIVLARNAAASIGNDTGPMHLIGPTDCPCLVLFSERSKPARHSPKGKHVTPVQKNNLNDLEPEDVFALFKPRETISKCSATMH